MEGVILTDEAGERISFLDFEETLFPFTVTAITDEGQVIWKQTVTEAPVFLEVPGTEQVSVVFSYADGTFEVMT